MKKERYNDHELACRHASRLKSNEKKSERLIEWCDLASIEQDFIDIGYTVSDAGEAALNAHINEFEISGIIINEIRG